MQQGYCLGSFMNNSLSTTEPLEPLPIYNKRLSQYITQRPRDAFFCYTRTSSFLALLNKYQLCHLAIEDCSLTGKSDVQCMEAILLISEFLPLSDHISQKFRNQQEGIQFCIHFGPVESFHRTCFIFMYHI